MVVKEWGEEEEEEQLEEQEEDYLLDTGDYYFKKGDYQKALEFYLKDPEAVVDVGNAYFKLKDYQKALEYYEKDSDALYQQGLMYFLLKDETKALKRWLHACLRGDTSAAIRIGIMFYIKSPEYSARWFWRVNDKFNLGFIFAFNKNIIFKDLPPITDSDIKFDLGNIYNNENNIELAHKYWLDSGLPKAADILNEIYKKQNKIKNVIFEDPPDTSKIVSKQRLLWPQYYNYYIQETSNKKLPKLILPDADDLEQDALVDYYDQGLLAMRTKNYDLARFFFTIGMDANYYPAINKLGELLYEHFKEYREAIDTYYKNVILDSEVTSSVTIDSMFKIGYIYYKFYEDYDLAIEWFKTALSNNYYLSYYYLGKTYLKLNQRTNAIDNFYLSSQHNNPGAYYYLGKITGDISFYKTAIELGSKKAILALGLHYVEKREYKNAIETLKLAIPINYAPALFELGKLYHKLNKKQEAADTLLHAAKYKNEDALMYLITTVELKYDRKEVLDIAYYFKFYNILFKIAKFYNIKKNYEEEEKIYKFILNNTKDDKLIGAVTDKLGELNIYKQDIFNAIKYFNISESKGHPKNKFAQNQNYIKIFDLINTANESDRAGDYYNVGAKFESLGPDFLNNAGIWYQKAADKSFSPAEYKLGFLFNRLDWMREAAKHNHPDALYYMSTITEDFKERNDYFEKALALNQKDAQYVRAVDLLSQNYIPEAVELFTKSSKNGNALASLELGNLEFDHNPDKALKYYALSIKQKPNPDAYFNSGLIYYQKAEKYKNERDQLDGKKNYNSIDAEVTKNYDLAKHNFTEVKFFKNFGVEDRLKNYGIEIFIETIAENSDLDTGFIKHKNDSYEDYYEIKEISYNNPDEEEKSENEEEEGEYYPEYGYNNNKKQNKRYRVDLEDEYESDEDDIPNKKFWTNLEDEYESDADEVGAEEDDYVNPIK